VYFIEPPGNALREHQTRTIKEITK